MYGVYELQNFGITLGDTEIEISGSVYKRGDVEKYVFAEDGKVVVNPVEPVNLPKNITRYLLVDLGKSVVLEPRSTFKLMLTFPIEIAIILMGKNSLEVLDVFSFISPKYTLYGDPRNGVICRYWQSEAYDEVEHFVKGRLEVDVTNSSAEWVEIKKLVFDVYGMKIYYYDEGAAAFAKMNILSEKVAETEFVDRKSGRKSIELYTVGRISISSRKFVMEWGF